MKLKNAKRFALALCVAGLGIGVHAGTADAQGSMPEGSYVCKPLSAENFLQPPPPLPIGDITPEEKAYLDSMKLPPDLCPPGMIAYPVPTYGDIEHPGGPAKSGPPSLIDPTGADTEAAGTNGSKVDHAKAKKKAKAKAKAKARRKKAKARAKKRRQAKSAHRR